MPIAETNSAPTLPSPRVWLGRLHSGYLASIRQGLEWCGAGARLSRQARVLVKPNLTFPEYRAGIMTNPECIEALIIALKDYTASITIGEADSGGYNRFSMTEVFAKVGLQEMAARYGVKLVNFSEQQGRPLIVKSGFRTLRVPLPSLLSDMDAFISVPVPKVHANTGVSLSLKNQWGVIQSPAERLKLHPFFTDVIHAITRALPPSLSVVDGQYGLTRNGPMRGDVVPLGWLAVGDNLYATDLTCCTLMRVPVSRVPHLRTILRREKLTDTAQVAFNSDSAAFLADSPFYLRREWTDMPGFATFHSRFLAWIGYESSLAKRLHWLLYKFREPFY